MGINLCGGNKMTKCWCGGSLVDCFHVDYLQCVSCGMFVSKKTTPEGYYGFQSYWHDKQINEYGFPSIEQRAVNDLKDRIPFWWDLIKGLKIKSVLEIGGAHGSFLSHCRSLGVSKCLGVEITEETCSFARKTFDLDMVCGKFPDVDINDHFDLVCGFDVFEHLDNPVKALNKMKSLGNYVMMQIPCYRGEGMSFPHFHGEEHLVIFTEDSIKSLFSFCGLEIMTKVRGAFPQDITIVGKKNV